MCGIVHSMKKVFKNLNDRQLRAELDFIVHRIRKERTKRFEALKTMNFIKKEKLDFSTFINLPLQANRSLKILYKKADTAISEIFNRKQISSIGELSTEIRLDVKDYKC